MGCFTEEAGERFVGKDVLGDGNTDVIAALGECGVLIKEEVGGDYVLVVCVFALLCFYLLCGTVVCIDCCWSALKL